MSSSRGYFYHELAPPVFSSGGCDLAKLRIAPFVQLDTLELATSFKIWETERQFSDFAPRILKVSLDHPSFLLLGWALRSRIVSHLGRARLKMIHEGSASQCFVFWMLVVHNISCTASQSFHQRELSFFVIPAATIPGFSSYSTQRRLLNIRTLARLVV